MLNGVYGWYDNVDKIYLPDSFMLARSERSVCRGYIQAFNNDKKMNPKEYELVKYGTFDDESGVFNIFASPERVDYMQVFAKEDTPVGETRDL